METLSLSAPEGIDPKNKKRGPRKFGSGERGFHAGSYPRVGPFAIYVKRPERKGETHREGRMFYMLDEYRVNGKVARTPPAEGWAFYLGRMYGPGTYRVHHNEDDKPARALIYVSADLAARGQSASDADEADDQADDAPTQDNPPISGIEATIQQIEALRRAQDILTPPAQPGLLETLAANPGLMQLLGAALAPKPNPPAPPPRPPSPPADPWSVVARFAAKHGITPEQAISVLHAATTQQAADDADAA